jgi:hypothetical protein
LGPQAFHLHPLEQVAVQALERVLMALVLHFLFYLTML